MLLAAREARGSAASLTFPEFERNRLVHGYFSVRLERVWDTVRQDIPRLISQLEPLAPPEIE